MTEPERLSAEERDNLVSYLDGELDEETTQAIEARLTQSPEARREADALRRTWELLDYLPKPRASETFTNRTLEKLETRRLVQTRNRRILQWAGGIGWAAALLVAGTAGFWLFQDAPPPPPPEPSPEDVRLYEHRDYWHYYEKVDGLEFLRELDRARLFPEDS